MAKPVNAGMVSRLVNGTRGFIAGVTGRTWFGPSQPLTPIAPPDIGMRRFDYPFGSNLMIVPRSQQADSISFEQLRALADGYDLLRGVIETRKDQVAKIPWTIRPVAIPGEPKQAQESRAQGDDRIKMLTDMMRMPDGEQPFETWIRKAMDEHLVIDALTIFPMRDKTALKKVWGFDIIDGSTIDILIDEGGRTPRPPDPAFAQIIKGYPAKNWSTDEMIYRPRNLRANRIYGFSPVEQLRMTVNLALRRQVSQISHYTDGNIPEAFWMLPDTWTPDQIAQMQSFWDSMGGDIPSTRRMKFMPGGGKPIFPKDIVLKDMMDEWLARIICFLFSLPPTALVRETNRGTAKTASDTATSEGLIPILVWLQNIINFLFVKFLGIDDLEFAWLDEEDPDKLKQAQIFAIYLGANGVQPVMTREEVRVALGMDPEPSIGEFPQPAPAPGAFGAPAGGGNGGPPTGNGGKGTPKPSKAGQPAKNEPNKSTPVEKVLTPHGLLKASQLLLTGDVPGSLSIISMPVGLTVPTNGNGHYPPLAKQRLLQAPESEHDGWIGVSFDNSGLW